MTSAKNIGPFYNGLLLVNFHGCSIRQSRQKGRVFDSANIWKP